MNLSLLVEAKVYWNKHPFLTSMVVFIFSFIIFYIFFVFPTGDPLPGDHYFHFKYAYLLHTEGIDVVKSFIWISPEGEIKNGSRYAVNLFQISLIPFTYFKDMLFGLQLADIFQASIFIAIIYYVMQKTKVKYPLAFTLGMLTYSYFIARLIIGRAFVVAVALVFVEMYFAINKKCKALFAITLLHILWHQNTYFMPLIAVGAVEVGRYLAINKMYWKNILSTLLGIIVGMAFFPGFPNSLVSWLNNIIKIQSTSFSEVGTKSIGGGELATKDFMNIFVHNDILIGLFVFCSVISIFIYFSQKKDYIKINNLSIENNIIWIYSLFIFMIGTMFGTIAMTGRFFDFLYPTFFILGAFLMTVLSRLKQIKINKFLGNFIKVSIIIIIFILIINTFIIIYGRANAFDYTPIRKSAQWFKQNSNQKDRIFLTNWSMFPVMFFENSYNIYTMGMEPMSLKNYDESLYWKYYNIFTYAYYCEELNDCKDKFNQDVEYLKSSNKERRHTMEKENGRKIIESIKNDFDSKFIMSTSDKLTTAFLLNSELIEKHAKFKSKKRDGTSIEYDVFKLK